MIAGPRFVLPFQTVVDAAGVPIPGALLNFYITGSDTRANTYSNSDLTTANDNPIDANAAGMFGNIFLDPAITYKVVLTDASGAEIWTADPVSGDFGIATNYTALRGFTSGAIPVVFVRGAVTVEDGGQGWFAYDPGDTTSTDNGGTIIVAGTLRWKRVYNGAAFPEWFGASPLGMIPADAAFTALLTLAAPIQGTPGAVYGLANPLVISGIPNFEATNLTLKDLTPGSATRKFVYGTGNTSVRLKKLKVLRNGSGAGGAFNTAAAVWIESASFIDITELEVTGNDAGAGLHLVSCAGGAVERPYIHDMTSGTTTSPDPGDGADQIAGLWVDRCTGVTVHAAQVVNLLTRCIAYTTAKNINTRGITLGGPGNGVALTDCFVTNVDEAYDITGDGVCLGWEVTNCRAEYCRKFGFKAAVTASVGRMVNCYAYRCTLDGFYIQGSNTAVSPTTDNVHDVQCIGCVAQETGYNVGIYYPGFTTSGFRADTGVADLTYPRNVWFVNCRAFGGADMKFGFNNSVGDAYLAQDRNRMVNCNASSATIAAAEGFVDGYSFLGRNTDQSIADSTVTAIIWNRAVNSIDGLDLIGGGATSDLEFPYAGRFLIDIDAAFEYDAAGSRVVDAYLNGAALPGSRTSNAACPDTATLISSDFILDVIAGDILSCRVQQTSGGALNLTGSDTTVRIVDQNSAQQLILVI